MNKKHFFSVITVVYNGEKTIARTIQSVLDQNFEDFEYIIIDGNSTDYTPRIVQDFLQKSIYREKNIKYIRESDDGIYDAMNKGTRLANGKWISFLNADDYYASRDVLNKVYNIINNHEAACVFYGNEIIDDGREKKINKRNLGIDFITKTLPFCHQSSFTNANFFYKKKFNIKYRICADYDFFLKLYLEGVRFFYMDMEIAVYNAKGLSNKLLWKSLNEVNEIKISNHIRHHGPLNFLRMIYRYIYVRIGELLL